MSKGPEELERYAYGIECFLNALRVPDCRIRTEIEEWIVKWLVGASGGGKHAIHHQSSIKKLYLADPDPATHRLV